VRERSPVGLHGGRIIVDAKTQVQALVRRFADTASPARECGQHAVAEVRCRRNQAIAGISAHDRTPVPAKMLKALT
jgi:hypothetical protein